MMDLNTGLYVDQYVGQVKHGLQVRAWHKGKVFFQDRRITSMIWARGALASWIAMVSGVAGAAYVNHDGPCEWKNLGYMGLLMFPLTSPL